MQRSSDFPWWNTEGKDLKQLIIELMKTSHPTGFRSRASWGGGPGWSAGRSSGHTGGTWRASPCCGCCGCGAAGWRRCWRSGRSIYTCKVQGSLWVKAIMKWQKIHKLRVISPTVLHNESGTCGLVCGKHNGTHTHTHGPTVPDMMEELV